MSEYALMNPHRLTVFGLLLLSVMFTGCAVQTQSAMLQQNPQWQNRHIILSGVPFHPQEQYQCGPAALASVLNASGVDVLPEQLEPQLYIAEKNGSLPIEIVAAARTYDRVAYPLDKELESIFVELTAGHPVLVFQNLGLDWIPQWHFAVAVGVDMRSDELVLHSGTLPFHRTALATFERTWNRADKWAYVILEPHVIPATVTVTQFLYTISQHEQLQQLELAERAITSALLKWPDNKLLQTALGNNYYKQGKIPAAEHAFREALKTHPNYAEAHNNLAQALLEQYRFEEALQSVQKAVQIGGRNLEQFQQTLTEIEFAMQQTPLILNK